MLLGSVIQQPNDDLDYDIHYEDWFANTADTLTSFSATVEPAGLNVLAAVASDSTGKLWVSGGVDGVKYVITVTGVTSGQRTKEDELIIFIQDFK